jgi:isoleucyl-tRNA synthetase
VQNVQRWELETGEVFTPMAAAAAADGSSIQQQQQQEPAAVLDRWILAAARSLTSFVRQEMEGYRLYTVVPQLVTFIEQLTNIYVRYNRKRLKVGLNQGLVCLGLQQRGGSSSSW